MCDEYGEREGYPRTPDEALAALQALLDKPKKLPLEEEVPVFCANCGHKWDQPRGWARRRKPEEIFCTTGCQEEYERKHPTAGPLF